MEGEAAAAVLQVLVQNLIDLSKKEISQIRDLDKDAAKLAETLKTIQKFLNDAEKRDITSEAVKNWLEKLENVAFDADNVLDELNYNILSKQIEPAEPEEEKLPSCFACFKRISRSRNMALKIKEINEKLESINEEVVKFGLVEKLANEPALVIAPLETDSYTLDPIFIGRDDDESEVVEMLTANSITIGEHAVSVISIVGMGGLGKTTLTRKVFNRLKNEKRFGSYIWVHVSPNFDPIILFKKILKEVSQNNKDILSKSDEVEGESKQDILSKLQQALKDKTYLLVLDDVWNEDRSKWEGFINSLLGVSSVVKGNAIVVTTRNMEVASIVNPLHVHQLKGLADEECWSIIRAKAFGKENVPSEFEDARRQIAKRCKGLPLAAKVIGGILSNQSEDKWRSIEEKGLSADGGGNNITNILRLSFDNLSPPLLKKCFAYCAMFPKGSKIIKQKLIEMWTAEGFLQAGGSDDMGSVGEKFINVLLHNSLLHVSERDYEGNVESYGMHDLVHDLACSVSSSSNNTSGSSRVRYMTLGDDNCGDISSPIAKEMAKSVRSLLISFKGDISDFDFSDFESLHVLHLDSEVKELSSSIGKLIHLRYFDTSKTRIDYLPSTIKYLINLRHLYINENVELPMGIGRLTSLQTLNYFPVGYQDGCKIEELGCLINLKGELEIWNLERVRDKEEAGKANLFKKSKILELCLKWSEDREGETNDEDVLEGLQPHSNLRKLEIDGFNGKRFPSWTLKMAVQDAPQSSWMVLNKLMSLSLWYCSECEEIPMLGHLPNLKSLKLWGLRNLKSINSSFYGMVNKDTRIVFPALEKLKLKCMDNLVEWAEIEISDGSEVKLFPRLKHLKIMWCEQLMSVPSLVSSCLEELEIHDIGVECLPADWLFSNSETLSWLEISDCPNLREISDRGGEESQGRSFTSLPIIFPRLTHLTITNCEQLMSIPSLVSSCLEELEIWGIGVEYLPGDWFLSSNQTLSRLKISFCRNLREISDRRGEESQERSFTSLPIIFPRLKHLEIKWCEQLMSVPSLVSSCLEELWIELIGVEYLPGDWFLSSNQTLSKLVIKDCPNLREISDRGGEESQGRSFTSLPIIFPRLKHLDIYKCEQLMSLPSLVTSCLEELEIWGIGVEYLPGDWFLSSNETLSRLFIMDCPNLREISDRGGEQSQGRSFTSLPIIFSRLKHLEITWCKQLMSVPSLVSSCLEELEIYEIGVEYLPGDWFLSSNQILSKLVIRWCPNLREISDWGGEQSQGRSFTSLPIIFPRLTHLTISECEQLMSVPSLVSTCLEELYIRGIGVECLPADWLFSSNQTLSSLTIMDCPNLREISDRGGEQSQGTSFTSLPIIFPRLTHLHIEGVPKLSLETVDAMRRLQIDGFKYINPDVDYEETESEKSEREESETEESERSKQLC